MNKQIHNTIYDLHHILLDKHPYDRNDENHLYSFIEIQGNKKIFKSSSILNNDRILKHDYDFFDSNILDIS